MIEPEGLRARPHRGRFPIPFVTAIDPATGRPDFRTHDDGRRLECALVRLCQLCGLPLALEPTVFVGQTPRRLVFGEPPMHESCFEFAWEVCPWLAGANWADRWRAEARDLEVLPPPPDSGAVTIFWVPGDSAWTCIPDDERPHGWKWSVSSVVWAEERERTRRVSR
jgi:hypothetical protein